MTAKSELRSEFRQATIPVTCASGTFCIPGMLPQSELLLRGCEYPAFPSSESGSEGGCSIYTSGLKVRHHDVAQWRPNKRMQLADPSGLRNVG
jgi:hypothetical protein